MDLFFIHVKLLLVFMLCFALHEVSSKIENISAKGLTSTAEGGASNAVDTRNGYPLNSNCSDSNLPCTSNDGYEAVARNRARLPKSRRGCFQHKDCTAPNTCSCDQEYARDMCEKHCHPVCHPECGSPSRCAGPWIYCECDRGYKPGGLRYIRITCPDAPIERDANFSEKCSTKCKNGQCDPRGKCRCHSVFMINESNIYQCDRIDNATRLSIGPGDNSSIANNTSRHQPLAEWKVVVGSVGGGLLAGVVVVSVVVLVGWWWARHRQLKGRLLHRDEAETDAERPSCPLPRPKVTQRRHGRLLRRVEAETDAERPPCPLPRPNVSQHHPVGGARMASYLEMVLDDLPAVHASDVKVSTYANEVETRQEIEYINTVSMAAVQEESWLQMTPEASNGTDEAAYLTPWQPGTPIYDTPYDHVIARRRQRRPARRYAARLPVPRDLAPPPPTMSAGRVKQENAGTYGGRVTAALRTRAAPPGERLELGVVSSRRNNVMMSSLKKRLAAIHRKS